MYRFIDLGTRTEVHYPVGMYMKTNINIVKLMAQRINELYPEGEIILWCRGSSGALISGMVSLLLQSRNINVCYVRKKHEESHTSRTMIIRPEVINIVVDDFIASGQTIKEILLSMTQVNIKPRCLCVSSGVPEEIAELFPIIIGGHIRGQKKSIQQTQESGMLTVHTKDKQECSAL